MDNINETFAANMTRLRTLGGMTQLELGEKLNYSDKAVSRWERGEAIPDAHVLVEISELFGITVDDLLKNSSVEPESGPDAHLIKGNKLRITMISFIGVWTVALLTFVVLYLCHITAWIVFPAALPVSLIVLLVFNSIWGGKKMRFIIVSLLVWSIILLIYLSLLKFNLWLLFLLGLPAQLIITLSFTIHKTR